jgi:hypothetical protein
LAVNFDGRASGVDEECKMREWLDVDSRLFPKPSRPSATPAPPFKIVVEALSPSRTPPDENSTKRGLYEYLNEGEAILSDYRAELAQLNRNPDGPGGWKRITARLGRFCLDSDSWGFEDMYQVVGQLQYTALELIQGLRAWDARTAGIVTCGLDLLQNLLHECERDYDRRLAVAGYLQGFAPEGF